MGDTEFETYNAKGKIIPNNAHITNYLEEDVFKRVEFYECSDGHYQGEAGYVNITLEDNEDDFSYTKNATAEWNEEFSGNMELELTDVEAKFIRDYVSNFNGGDDDDNINYSKDFILTDEQNKMLESITERIRDEANDFTPEYADGEEREWYTYEANVSEMTGDVLNVVVSKSYTVYRDSE
jgi:hypothetical protein